VRKPRQGSSQEKPAHSSRFLEADRKIHRKDEVWKWSLIRGDGAPRSPRVFKLRSRAGGTQRNWANVGGPFQSEGDQDGMGLIDGFHLAASRRSDKVGAAKKGARDLKNLHPGDDEEGIDDFSVSCGWSRSYV
jgi:hypothetical protein